jgi:plastocyanin
VLLVSAATVADACPWARRCCYPPPVYYYYPQCPPPVVVRVAEAPAPEKKVDAAKADVAPDGWCHIRGRIVYDGTEIPKRKEIPKSNGAYTEDWVVNPTNRGVQNVVVWLVPELTNEQMEALKSRKLREVPGFQANEIYPGLMTKEDATVLIPEKPMAFVPHIATVRAGSEVVFYRESTVPHNVKWDSRNNGMANLLVPPGRQATLKNTKPERYPIVVVDSIYPWMEAYAWVFDHPYFAVTDGDGRFELKFAPKGNLRLVVWQESLGFKGGREGRWGEAIRVPDGKLDLGDIKLKPGK